MPTLPRRHSRRLARGVYIDPGDGKRLFKDFAEQWRDGQMHRQSMDGPILDSGMIRSGTIIGNRASKIA